MMSIIARSKGFQSNPTIIIVPYISHHKTKVDPPRRRVGKPEVEQDIIEKLRLKIKLEQLSESGDHFNIEITSWRLHHLEFLNLFLRLPFGSANFVHVRYLSTILWPKKAKCLAQSVLNKRLLCPNLARDDSFFS